MDLDVDVDCALDVETGEDGGERGCSVGGGGGHAAEEGRVACLEVLDEIDRCVRLGVGVGDMGRGDERGNQCCSKESLLPQQSTQSEYWGHGPRRMNNSLCCCNAVMSSH